MISALVPVDLARRPVNLLLRIQRLLIDARKQSLRVVIGHNDRGRLPDRLLRTLCELHGATLASGAFYDGDVNTARLRNEAIERVKTPLTLLLDADVRVSPSVLADVGASVLSNEQPFQVLPCLYLSRRGSASFTRGRVLPEALLSDYLRFKRSSFLHMAIPSSVTVFRTVDYRRAGAFDSGFSGHGYEDLDFLMRLAWLHKAIPRSVDLLVDAPSRAPLLALGFRGWLARLALPSLLRGQVAFHLWHSTRRDVYYDARKRNATMFRQKIAAQLPEEAGEPSTGARPFLDLDLIGAWSEMCRVSNVDPRQYSVLFDNRPGHADRLDTPIRRLKFLLGSY